MNPTDKIAAEAAGQICRMRSSLVFSQVEAIIQTAIEKVVAQEAQTAREHELWAMEDADNAWDAIDAPMSETRRGEKSQP